MGWTYFGMYVGLRIEGRTAEEIIVALKGLAEMANITKNILCYHH